MQQGKIGRRLIALVFSALLGLMVTPLRALGDIPSDEQHFVELINKTRAGVGVAPLKLHLGIADVARAWSEQMRKTHVATKAADPTNTDGCIISHNPNLAKQVTDRWLKLGENVGCGDVGVDELNRMFNASEHHYANIVDPKFNYIGIGIVYEGDLMFVTEQFMYLPDAPAPVASVAGTNAVPNALALGAPTSIRKGTSDKVYTAAPPVVVSASIRSVPVTAAPPSPLPVKSSKVRTPKKSAKKSKNALARLIKIRF